MKQDQNYFDFHLLICANERGQGREDCGSKGAGKLIDELKPWLKSELKKIGREGRARINKSGCLGRCEEGIACVAYPGGEWLTEVRSNEQDIQRIQEWIRQQLKEL